MNQALAEVDDDFKKSYKMKIKALLDVKKQKGWPGNVVWPEEEQTWNTRSYLKSFLQQ